MPLPSVTASSTPCNSCSQGTNEYSITLNIGLEKINFSQFKAIKNLFFRKDFENMSMIRNYKAALTIASLLLMASKQNVETACTTSNLTDPKEQPCILKSVPLNHLEVENQARIIGTVKDIQCGIRSQYFQQYVANIEVEKTVRGNVKSPVQITFTQFFTEHKINNSSYVSFRPQEKVELTLTQKKKIWSLEFPFHKRTLTESHQRIPNCLVAKRKF